MEQLVRQMAKDLEINPFPDEIREEYNRRLLYSAVVAWAKVQLLGKAYVEIEDDDSDTLVSKRWSLEQLQLVTKGLLTVIECEEDWLLRSENLCVEKELAKYVLNQLIFCHQIGKACNGVTLMSVPHNIISFRNNELLIGGVEWNSSRQNAYSVGAGMWRAERTKESRHYIEANNLPNKSIDEYYHMLDKQTKWQPDSLDREDYEYFSVEERTYKSSWKSFNRVKVLQGITLIRKSGKEQYLLLKRNEENWYTGKLDEWYLIEKEVQRIMYILKCRSGYPVQFRATVKQNRVELNCYWLLPHTEARILYMASWPKRSYKDIYYRIIPKILWEDIEEMLTRLGIQIYFEEDK